MYYLQSRYYDPEVCRFINADEFASTGQGVLGCNMFAYCNNSPVVCVDSEGTQPVQNKMLMSNDGGGTHSLSGNVPMKKKPFNLVDCLQETWGFFVNDTKVIGFSASASWGANAQASIGIAFDGEGNFAIVTSNSGGGGTPTASVQAFKSISNCPTIKELEGNSVCAGGSANVYYVLTAGYDVALSSNQAAGAIYYTSTSSAGIGVKLPAPFEVHAGISNTKILQGTSINIFDWMRT